MDSEPNCDADDNDDHYLLLFAIYSYLGSGSVCSTLSLVLLLTILKKGNGLHV